MPSINFPQNFGTFDYGNVLRTVEAVRGQRIQNALAGMSLQQAQEKERNRQRIRAIKKQQKNMPQILRQLEQDGFHDEAQNMRAQARQQIESSVKMMEGVAGTIEQSNDPSGTYKFYRERMLRAGIVEPDEMPVDYSKSWLRKQIRQTRGKLSTLEQIVDVAPGGTPIRQQITQTEQGQEVARSPRFQRPGERRSTQERIQGRFRVKPSDAREIGRQIGQLFGGVYDPVSGKFAGLDRESASRAQAAQEEAERLYSKGGGRVTPGAAATEALRKLGVDIERLRGGRMGPPQAEDPLNLLGQRRGGAAGQTAPGPFGR